MIVPVTVPVTGRVRRDPAPDGLVIIDKPAGFTSHDVVGKMRGIAATRKVGHAGTLDPMATGVLVVGIGKATRLLTHIVGADKDYDATIRLGVGTTTEDAQGEVTDVSDPGPLGLDQIVAAAATLTGDIMQVPSSVSAIKVDGKRAYDRVRAGESVELKARPATVAVFEVLSATPVATEHGPCVDVEARVSVSSGTYVRALARDLAAALGTFGHLTALRRTRVGGYQLDQARTLDQLQGEVEQAGAITVLPLAQAAAGIMDVRELSSQEVTAIGYGQRLKTENKGGPPRRFAGVDASGELIALLEDDGTKIKPFLVFAPASS